MPSFPTPEAQQTQNAAVDALMGGGLSGSQALAIAQTLPIFQTDPSGNPTGFLGPKGNVVGFAKGALTQIRQRDRVALNNNGALIQAPVWSGSQALAGVAITGTAGQFSCTAATNPIAIGQVVTIAGTLGGTGTITGYANPTTYYVIATNGSTTFQLSATLGGAGVVTTAAGT